MPLLQPWEIGSLVQRGYFSKQPLLLSSLGSNGFSPAKQGKEHELSKKRAGKLQRENMYLHVKSRKLTLMLLYRCCPTNLLSVSLSESLALKRKKKKMRVLAEMGAFLKEIE